MNKKDEQKAALARQATAIFRNQTPTVSRATAEREDELAKRVLITSRLKALRLGREAEQNAGIANLAANHEET